VGLERGPLSLVSTIEELLEKKKNSGPSVEIRDYCHMGSAVLTSGVRSVGIVLSGTQTTEFVFRLFSVHQFFGIHNSHSLIFKIPRHYSHTAHYLIIK
jgi:hypothetical protein